MCLFCLIIQVLSSHEADPVSGLVGLNSSTGGNNSEGKTMIGEWKDMFGNPATVHSCYGVGNDECEEKNYWDDGIANNGADLPKWVPAYRYDNPQNKIDGE